MQNYLFLEKSYVSDIIEPMLELLAFYSTIRHYCVNEWRFGVKVVNTFSGFDHIEIEVPQRSVL